MSFNWRVWRWDRPRVLAVASAATLVAGAGAGLVIAQPASQRHRAVTSVPSTTFGPSGWPAFADPSTTDTTDTTIAEPIETEPSVPATPSPPPATPVLTSNSTAPVIYRLRLSAPVVFVTIDDGWVRDPRIISFLRQSGWPVSVFLIERAALKDPNYFRQLSAAGATIEDHTYDHPYLTSLGADRQTYEVCRPEADYGGLLGHTPTLLRPPYGAWNPTTQNVAHSCGLAAVVEWSATMSAGRLAVAGPRLRGGDIILLHFTSTLYNDLVDLRSILASGGFAVGRLESYLSAPATTPDTAAAPTTSTAPATSTASTAPTSSTVPANSTTTITTIPPATAPPSG
jgi:peptidoglycan/xylan/chitin deacetylase (PgdA/CDA1 family)